MSAALTAPARALEPRPYFDLARELYERVSVPPRFAETKERLSLSPEEIETEFLRTNPWLTPDMISVTCCDRALLDIRVCFGRDLGPRNCGPNEARRDCRLREVSVPASGPPLAPRPGDQNR